MSDYHLHLHPHAGSDDPADAPQGRYPDGHLSAYVEAALERGATELGFTEHLYRCREAAPVLGRFWEDDDTPSDVATLTADMVEADLTLSLEDYVGAVLAAKKSGLPVKLGLEVDFFPETIEAVTDLLEPYPWDFLIGAVHWIGGWAIDASHSLFEFDRRGIDRAWDEYFALEAQLAASGTVDVLAHVDVIKKYGLVAATDPTPWYEAVVSAAAGSGTAVEVSSQGLRYPTAEVYPAPDLLGAFHRAGVAITLASDAHRPSQAGWGHDEVVEAARAAGYESHLRFSGRVAHPHPL
ncbi:MAG: histidinol-phosphatase HisJ family protein [Acidimicrobiia bacterium]